MDLTPLHFAFPTLSQKNVPVPAPSANGGWWHPESAPQLGSGYVARVDPTWSGQADNLIANGAMAETSYHYPSGGIRPGNNEPEFLTRFVSTEGGNRLHIPHQKPTPFYVQPYDSSFTHP